MEINRFVDNLLVVEPKRRVYMLRREKCRVVWQIAGNSSLETTAGRVKNEKTGKAKLPNSTERKLLLFEDYSLELGRIRRRSRLP